MACTKSDVKRQVEYFQQLGNTGQVFPVLTPIIIRHVLHDDLINTWPQLDHKFHQEQRLLSPTIVLPKPSTLPCAY